MVDRIKQVMEHYEETPASFAEKVGVNRSNLTHVFSGRNQPSLDFAKKVLVAFPEVSTEWLIMGVGKMIKNPDETPVVKREFVQTDLFASIDENETPESEVEMFEETITNGTENDIQEPSEEISSDDVKTDEVETTPSDGVEDVETEVVKSVEQPVVTAPESIIPKQAVHPSRKSNSRTVEKVAAKTPVERPRTVSMERPVATPIDRPRTVAVERPVAAQTEKVPAPREKKIEKIIFFYDDDTFKVYHP